MRERGKGSSGETSSAMPGSSPARRRGAPGNGLDPDVTSGPRLVVVIKEGRTPVSAGMSVGDTAALAGVTVRTLHHYDRIGLLTPSERTAAGYRRYTPADLDRLHRVLVYRELGFP